MKRRLVAVAALVLMLSVSATALAPSTSIVVAGTWGERDDPGRVSLYLNASGGVMATGTGYISGGDWNGMISVNSFTLADGKLSITGTGAYFKYDPALRRSVKTTGCTYKITVDAPPPDKPNLAVPLQTKITTGPAATAVFDSETLDVQTGKMSVVLAG